MKFSIKDLFTKCDQIGRKLQIWSHLLKKSLIENFIFGAVCIHLINSTVIYFNVLRVTFKFLKCRGAQDKIYFALLGIIYITLILTLFLIEPQMELRLNIQEFY